MGLVDTSGNGKNVERGRLDEGNLSFGEKKR